MPLAKMHQVGNGLLLRTRLTAPVALAAMLAKVVALAHANAGESNAHQEFLRRLVAAAIERTHHAVRYDPAYVKIPYPGGDVPAGMDLQKEVHEDMKQNFSAYPRRLRWLAWRPDANIDHRRVPNLMVFFSRKGETLGLARHAGHGDEAAVIVEIRLHPEGHLHLQRVGHLPGFALLLPGAGLLEPVVLHLLQTLADLDGFGGAVAAVGIGHQSDFAGQLFE